MADILEQYLPKKKGPSMMVQVAVLAGMTVAALGTGWLAGRVLGGEVPAAAPAAGPAPALVAKNGKAEAAGGKGNEGGEGEAEPAPPPGSLVLKLPAITTNLAAPSDTWLRMELAVQLDQPNQDPTLAETIQQDLLAYVRTVKLHQIEGASGFQHLKADLAERAAIRSDGHVKAVLINTLLFE
jgi:flagellar protein FliL